MPKPGQAHHNAKLSDEDVLEMRQLRESRPWLWSYRALADYFGCGESTARDVVTYRTRYNLTAEERDQAKAAARADLDAAIITFSAMAKEAA